MFAALLLATAALAASPEAQPLVDSAKADAAKRFGVDAQVTSVQRVTWRDGSLGCPQKGMAYTEALVPGWRLTLKAGERSFDYHASNGGRVIYCAPGRAQEPLPDSAT